MKRILVFVASLALLAFTAAAPAGAGVSVFVSILPQKHFVERIAGDLAEVTVMVMPGASPATYEPSPRQMAKLSDADAYLAIGVPFEDAWLSRFKGTSPEMVVVRTDRGIDKLPMGKAGHGHGEGVPDPHIWLSPLLAGQVAENTARALARIDPSNEAAYMAGLERLVSDIDGLDADIKAILAPIPEPGRVFMVFHPSWGYFAKRYGLTQVAIEAGGREPGPRQLAETIERGREMGIRVVFVQPQFSEKSARVLASEMGARVAELDPLAEDWEANLREAALAFREALRAR